VPETRAQNPARIDKPGTVLLATVILCLLLPMSLGPVLHWPWQCIALLMLVAPLLWALWRIELMQERRRAFPLLPPSLLRLPSMRFGLCIAVLFFSSWSGFMFSLALTLQSGVGLSPMQSGNAFIAMGSAFFVGSLMTSRAVARFDRLSLLLFGCAVQMTGLLALMFTLREAWPHPTPLMLVPATVLIGFGQAFIVGCFFRIGLSEVPTEQAGAGSSMLSTVQQASLGLGPALLGAVLTQTLHLTGGNHLEAVLAALAAEFCLMLMLVALVIVQFRRQIATARTHAAAQRHACAVQGG
jgi:predicted MFS family arabinose efflux permease